MTTLFETAKKASLIIELIVSHRNSRYIAYRGNRMQAPQARISKAIADESTSERITVTTLGLGQEENYIPSFFTMPWIRRTR